MSSDTPNRFNRRLFLGTAAAATAGLAMPALAQQMNNSTAMETTVTGRPSDSVRRNISSFRTLQWQPYFDNLRGGAILVDITSRALHYWSEDQSIYRLYPTSVPLSEDLTRRGRTTITVKDAAPGWRPTPAMKQRNPEWPDFVAPGAPDNPMGTRSMHLSWTYYRIHGTHDTRKIGRQSSNGCIGMYNEHVEELFNMAKVGTQVLLI